MALPKKAVNWFDSYILVYNVNKATLTIPIILSPTGINENISASYDQQTSPGRSAPIVSYSGTGARTLSFSMRVSVDALPREFGKDLYKYINYLKSLLYPDYKSDIGVIRSPHCLVVIGNLKLDGVCTSFGGSYQDLFAKNGQFSVVDIDLSFTEVLETAPGNVNIIQGSSAVYTYTGGSGNGADISPTLTLGGDGVGIDNTTYYLYKRMSSVLINDTGGCSYYPAGMCSVGYTYKRPGEAESSMKYNIGDITHLFNMANVGDVYYLYYHLFYNGNEVDNQKKCRKVKIS